MKGVLSFENLISLYILKIFTFSNKHAQEIIRSLDKKSNYRFPFIAPPEVIENEEENKDLNDKEMKASQAT